MKQLIKRILKESIKEKLERRLEEDGLVETLNTLGIDFNQLLSMLEMSMDELIEKHNPFEGIFSDEEFEKELNESIKFLTKQHFSEHLRNESLDNILKFLISNIIDSFHDKLIDFDTETWIIPETPKLLKIIYGDRIINHPKFIKWVRTIKNK